MRERERERERGRERKRERKRAKRPVLGAGEAKILFVKSRERKKGRLSLDCREKDTCEKVKYNKKNSIYSFACTKNERERIIVNKRARIRTTVQDRQNKKEKCL